MTKAIVTSWIGRLMLLLCVFVLSPGISLALDMSQVRVNGFASQGYLVTEGNNYLVSESKEGSFDLNELGITFNAQVTDKVKFGAQLLSRDFGDEGNNNVVLDWGYGDYRFTDAFGLRAGLIKQPLGLYNETRDSDYLRPMALLPESVYSETRRSYGAAMKGVAIYGNFGLGAGNLEYNFLTGYSDVNDDTYDLRGTVLSLSGLGAEVTDVQWRMDKPAITARVLYNTPLSGLRFGITYNELQGHVEVYSFGQELSGITFDPDGPGPAPAIPQTHNDVFSNTTDHFVYSVEYATDSFTLSSECNLYKTETDVLGIIVSESDVLTNYIQVSVPVSEVLTVSGLYDQYFPNKDERDDPDEYRKDLGIGLRYDVAPGFAIKAEHHVVDGSAGVDSLRVLNPAAGFPAPDLDDNWSYSIVKASFVF